MPHQAIVAGRSIVLSLLTACHLTMLLAGAEGVVDCLK